MKNRRVFRQFFVLHVTKNQYISMNLYEINSFLDIFYLFFNQFVNYLSLKFKKSIFLFIYLFFYCLFFIEINFVR